MIQYLEYLKRIFFTTGTKYIGIILSELTLYQKVYLKYGNLKQNNPVYPKDKPKIWNTHCFPIPPANEHYFNLTWDIGYIYESLISDKIIEYMAAEEIKKFCEIDIKASEERSFKEIRKNIKPKYPHTYQEILIAFYQPLEYDMINFHTANLRPTKSLGVREPRVWLSETKRKTPECSGVSFFRAGNSNSLTNAFHICVYVHLCVVPRYIASQHPWKQSQSLLQNTKETTAGHFRRSVFLLSGRIPGVHELLWKAASLSCGRYR